MSTISRGEWNSGVREGKERGSTVKSDSENRADSEGWEIFIVTERGGVTETDSRTFFTDKKKPDV